MYEATLEFPRRRGGGVQNKKPSIGGVWIFSGTTHYEKENDNYINYW